MTRPEQHSVSLALLPPRSDEVRSLPFGADEVDRDELYSAPAVPEMRFTDSHGSHWGRDGNGLLHRLDARSPRRKPHTRDDGRAAHEDTGRDDGDWVEAHQERAGAPEKADTERDGSARQAGEESGPESHRESALRSG